MASISPPPARTGTQSIERAIHLMRELAFRGSRGWGLRGLSIQCELDTATTHRILKCLVAEGLVQQRKTDKRYLLGPLNYELGISVSNRSHLNQAARQAVRHISRKFPKVTASVVVRSGDDCVCVARAGTASFMSEASGIREGERVPLLSRLSGMHILAALPQEIAQGIIIRNRKRLAHFGDAFAVQAEDIVQTSKGQGYALSPGIFLHQVNSIAVCFGEEGTPAGALAMSALCDDYSVTALKAALPELKAAATVLTSQAPDP